MDDFGTPYLAARAALDGGDPHAETAVLLDRYLGADDITSSRIPEGQQNPTRHSPSWQLRRSQSSNGHPPDLRGSSSRPTALFVAGWLIASWAGTRTLKKVGLA